MLTLQKPRLNFKTSAAGDTLQVAGVLPVPVGFAALNQRVGVDAGGVVKGFTLNAKGRSPKANSTFALAVKSSKGVVFAHNPKFTIKFSKQSVAAKLSDEGLVGTATVSKVPREVVVTVVFNGEVYQKRQSLLYSAKQGASGSAK